MFFGLTIMSYVKTKSSAVIGWPSDHVMSSRSFIVITLPSAEMPPFVGLGSSLTRTGNGSFLSSNSQAQAFQIWSVI